MVTGLLKRVFGSNNERVLKQLWPIVSKINDLEASMKKLSDAELGAQTIKFRERLERGEELDSLLPEAFATVREAAIRVLGMRHFDVQLIGGAVLHSGKIAEMKTGEGKTLCATLPVYLNALPGKGVHVVTVNDYLARRDAEWMGRVYSFLGLSTGVILTGIDPSDRKQSYAADITYGQNNEFGFDFLRDNMKLELSDMAQRGHNFAIVDEVDSILVDEARTPLIISGPSEEATDKYRIADELVRKLQRETDFTVEEKSKQVTLTDDGVRTVEGLLGITNLYDPVNISLVHHVTQALKAHVTMKRDVDYVSRNGQIIIVDEFTGRLMPGRRWSDGLHQAVEAKEGVKIARENQTLATVTFQNYFRLYKKLAGMTGTADTEAVEFKKIYGLEVVVIPTNKDMIRKDHSDIVFIGEEAKFRAVCKEIAELAEKGQPVLVGTASIAKSEVVSELLKQKGIPHHVLNAKQHEREAEIVAQAGRFGAVTISTNMAGRGTDIVLGGNPEFLAAAAAGTKDPEDPTYQEKLAEFRASCAEERKKVVEAGGLHIIGTERHESRRIDNQLRGRSGRQGDPGSSRFYVSMEDELMRRFGGEQLKKIMSSKVIGMREDDAIEGRLIAGRIEGAQKKVEGFHFDIRKHLLEYDNVLSKQREVIYSLREKILRADALGEQIQETIGDVLEEVITTRASDREPPASWDIAGMVTELNRLFGLGLDMAEFAPRVEKAGKDFAQELFEDLRDRAHQRFEERRQHFGPERMHKLARIIYLQSIDHFWKDHLSNMDHLKEGIGLRGWGQKNPLYEYQSEAFYLFAALMSTVKNAVIQNLFLPELPSDEELRKIEEREIELQRQREAAATNVHEDVIEGSGSAPAGGGEALVAGNRQVRRQQPEVMGDAEAAQERDAQNAERARKEAARKKNKAAKKARRRGR